MKRYFNRILANHPSLTIGGGGIGPVTTRRHRHDSRRPTAFSVSTPEAGPFPPVQYRPVFLTPQSCDRTLRSPSHHRCPVAFAFEWTLTTVYIYTSLSVTRGLNARLHFIQNRFRNITRACNFRSVMARLCCKRVLAEFHWNILQIILSDTTLCTHSIGSAGLSSARRHSSNTQSVNAANTPVFVRKSLNSRRFRLSLNRFPSSSYVKTSVLLYNKFDTCT